MTRRLSDSIRGILKIFGMQPGALSGVPVDRRVDAIRVDWEDKALIIHPMLRAWRQLHVQIAAIDRALRPLNKPKAFARPQQQLPLGVPAVITPPVSLAGFGEKSSSSDF